MFSICSGCVAVLLLTLIQSIIVSGSSNNVEIESKASIETVSHYLQLPWMDGIERMSRLSEYPDGEEVQVFIRAIESGETWALRILDTLWEHQTNILQKHTTGSDLPSVDRDPTTSYKDRDGLTVNDTTRERPIESKDFTMPEMCTIISFATIGVFLLCCTICDFLRRSRPADQSAILNTLAKFSLYTNAVELLVKKPTNGGMSAIHGIRCLGFFSVLLGHHHMIVMLVTRQEHNLLEFMRWKDSWFAVYMEMTSFAVDTFSVLSGFLAAHLFFKIKQSGAKLNVLTMYLHRYLRITPCQAVTLLFVVVFFPRCGNGSMWETSNSMMGDPCREKWWINLLYLQNIYDPDPICLLNTWYLSLDMQLFWLAPLILYPLLYSRKIGLRVLSFFLVVSLVTPAVVLAMNGYSNALLRFDKDMSSQAENAFFYTIPTYNRAAPYLIGIFIGYDVATRKRHLSRAIVVINWLLSVALAILCTWGTHRIYNCTFAYDLRMEIASTILLRPTWSIVNAWVIYACTQDYGGLVTRFLSLRIFVPFSRLSYCIFTVHMVIQVIRHTPAESSVVVLSSPLFDGVFGDLVMSTGVALVLHLFIETLCNVLNKMMLVSRVHQPESTTIDTVEEMKKNL